MGSNVHAIFYTNNQKNGFLALNSKAATSLGSKCEVRNRLIATTRSTKLGPYCSRTSIILDVYEYIIKSRS